MNKHKEGHGDQPESRQHGLDVPPGAQQEQSFYPGHVAQRRQNSKKQRFGDIPLKDRLIFWVTFGAFLAAGITAYILEKQARIMTDTLQEIRGSGRQTERALILQRGQTIQAVRQANAAQDSVKAIKDQFRKDQRPLIKLSGIRGEDKNIPEGEMDIVLGRTLTVTSRFVNVGKGVARDIVVKAYLECVKATAEPDLKRVNSKNDDLFYRSVSGVLFSTEHVDVHVVRPRKNPKTGIPEPSTLSLLEFNSLGAGQSYLALYGVVDYGDTFGIRHWTKFCLWLPVNQLPADFHAMECTRYNQIDAN